MSLLQPSPEGPPEMAVNLAAVPDRSLLEVRDLCIEVDRGGQWVPVVDGVSFAIRPGETLGIVGESGSGKSLTASAAIQLLPRGARISGGDIRFDGDDLLGRSVKELQRLRRSSFSMIFQDPHNSLNPAFTIGHQLVETLRTSQHIAKRDAVTEAARLLDKVGIARARDRLDDYAHQLSGGMAQRVMIALALANRPKLLVADEPTTALDVTVQAQVLRLLRSLQEELSMSLLLISHDISVIAEMADDVKVMYAGQFVEDGPVRRVLREPSHPYTEALLLGRPGRHTPGGRLPAIRGSVSEPGAHPAGCRFHTRCDHAVAACATDMPEAVTVDSVTVRCVRRGELSLAGVDGLAADAATTSPSVAARPTEPLLEVRGISRSFDGGGSFLRRSRPTVMAVDDVSFSLGRGETLGLVGESGAGKTTVGRIVLGVTPATAGTMRFEDQDLDLRRWSRDAAVNRRAQVVYQNPYASLDPLMTVGDTIAEPLEAAGRSSKRERQARVATALQQVGLDVSYAHRYPSELSGGQRQRVAIARVLTLEPALIVCDEPVSALDVSTEAQVINLLMDLQEQIGISYLFIGHDLGVVHHVSDRIGVMYQGRIVELGPSDDVFHRPVHPYTKLLLSSILSADPDHRRLPSLTITERDDVDRTIGCPFAPRCAHATDVCRTVAPPVVTVGASEVRCHLAVTGASG